jgi:hypothetical protein
VSMNRAIRSAGRNEHPHAAALVAASAAVDAVAAGILLLDTPLPPSLEALAAVVSHATAVLLLLGLARARPGRRWLIIAPVLAIPCLGAAVAAATLVTRGRGTIAMERRRIARRRTALTMGAIQDIGGALSPCDALESGDEQQRRAALSALSGRGDDPEALALLRRAAAGNDPDLALSAALVLDGISERAERRVGRRASGGRT